MRVAVIVAQFPVASETFILRQIGAAASGGHDMHIYADSRPEPGTPQHDEIGRLGLLRKVTYVCDGTPESSTYWEWPARPLWGRTWLPGSAEPIRNLDRWRDAVPHLTRLARSSPLTAIKVLQRSNYGPQAASLSTLYRASALSNKRGDHDLVHAHFGQVANSYRFVKDLWRVPFIVSFHGYDFQTFPREHGSDVYRDLFATADLFICASSYAERRLRDLGCPAEKLRRLPYGVDTVRFDRLEGHDDRGPFRIVTVARLNEVKGLDLALEAMGYLRDRLDNFSYEIIGDGPLREELERSIADMGLEDRVHLSGALDNASVHERLVASDLFLLPSRREAFGVVLLEAQACRLPIVSMKHGGIAEAVVDGVSGILLEDRDAESMADVISTLAGDPERRRRMGRRGRQHVVDNYSIEAVDRQLIRIYTEATARVRSGPTA